MDDFGNSLEFHCLYLDRSIDPSNYNWTGYVYFMCPIAVSHKFKWC